MNCSSCGGVRGTWAGASRGPGQLEAGSSCPPLPTFTQTTIPAVEHSKGGHCAHFPRQDMMESPARDILQFPAPSQSALGVCKAEQGFGIRCPTFRSLSAHHTPRVQREHRRTSPKWLAKARALLYVTELHLGRHIPGPHLEWYPRLLPSPSLSLVMYFCILLEDGTLGGGGNMRGLALCWH